VKLTPRLTLIFILYAAALLSVVGMLAYTSGRNSLRSATISELSATAIEKQATLNQWVEEKKSHIAALSADPTIIKDASKLMAASPNSLEAQFAHDAFVAKIQPRIAIGEFLVVMLIDPRTGEVIAATDPGEEGKFKEDRPFFLNGKTGPYVQNLYYSVALQSTAMMASAPLKGSGGQLLGVLAGRIDLEEMNSIITRRSGLRQTDDAFLVNTSNLFVTQPYLVTDPAVLQLGVRTEAVNRCLKQSSGTIEADDYRGVPSVINYLWLPERELCLIVKIDQVEAYAPARAFGRTVAGISALALLIAAGLAVTLSRSLTRPILALQSGAAHFRQGELDIRLPETSRDELGALAREFNQMAASISEKDNQLRAYSFELEERVAERTDELQQSEERFRLATEASPNAMIMSGQDGKISFVNRAAVALFGYAEDELIRSPLEALVPERFRASHPAFRETFFGDAHARPMGKGRDLYALRKDGEEVPVEIGLSPVETREGLFALATITDISERKQAQEAILKLNEELEERVILRTHQLEAANKELEAFSYSVSHDLRAPLRSIDGFSQILLEDYGEQLPPEGRQHLDRVRSAAQRMAELIDDLLKLARITRAPMQPQLINLSEIAEGVSNTLEEQNPGRNITVSITPDLTVNGDSALLTIALENLLSNAWKFTSKKEQALIEFGTQFKDEERSFFIRDNGAGFDMTYVNKLFGVFQRLHAMSEFPGTGVGLATVQRIIKIHGGRVWAEAEEGKGATFYFTL
jgi:PAS domain S-box-containing protein